ncbi:MAG: ATPase V [Bacteroidales bacterium]|nr:ATPase V [Bacteroidales bacterium]
MIASMTKYSFILLNGQQKDLLEMMQGLGLVDITRSTRPVDDKSRDLLAELELLDGLIQGLEKAEIPEGTAPEFIDGDIVRLTGGMLMRYTDDTAEIKQLQKEVDALRVWGDFDLSVLEKLDQAGVPLHFHSLSNKLFQDKWAEDCALTVVAKDKNTTWFVVAGEDTLPGELTRPVENVSQKEKELRDKQKHFERVLQRIAGAKERLDELKEKRARTYEQLDLYLADASAVSAAEDTIVTLVGYAPAEAEATVTEALDKAGVFYFKEAAQAQDRPPIQLKNNWFVRQFEVLTDMYGRPAYDGFDPTPFISVFFLLFFALCMGDAGYGLVLIAVGLLLRRVPSFKDLAPLVTLLGMGTVVVGFFLHTFFSIDIAQWKVFEPVKFLFLPDEIAGYAGGMVLAIVVGVVHLCLAMVVKAIQTVKVNGWYASLGTLGWTLLIVGGVITGGFALAGVLSSDLTKWIVIVLGIVSALGIFVFNDPKRNKFANIGMGLWDTYNTVTGLLGDVLSYLRLYALGLAGSMLGMAFNDMGMMVLGDGTAVGKWFGFILLVLLGHTLNVAMCALGAFVHPLRLNFLEFFKNSGYEALGRPFNPLKKQ